MTYRYALGTAALILALAGTAAARTAPNITTPITVKQLLECRSLADSAQRLACYDRQAAVMSQAIATRELVVIDKARANQAKRSLFGFSVPSFGGLFGGNEDDIKQIESTVASVGRNAEGGWLLKLADGSVWSQVDDVTLGLEPRRGDKVVVKRGLMGGFHLDIGKQPGFRTKRVG
jgi:hypothetical protein